MADWAEWVWLNGRMVKGAEASVSVFDRSFQLGDGLFETVRACQGRIFRLNEHLARLREGLSILHFSTPWDGQSLHFAIHELLDANSLRDAAVRLTVSRGVGAGGLEPRSAGPPTVVITARLYTGPPDWWYQTGMSAIFSQVVKNERSPLCGVKSTSHAEHVLARFDAMGSRKDEALMLNTQGYLVEGSSSNLFVVMEGRLCTPDLSSGCLPGITRAAVLELAREVGIEVSEVPLLPETIPECQEAFLTNSLMGIGPLVWVAGQSIGAERHPDERGTPGPITRVLAKRYLDALGAPP
jgi:aminodeoxychorismate lyase